MAGAYRAVAGHHYPHRVARQQKADGRQSVNIITLIFWDTLVLGLVDSAMGTGFGIRGMVLLISVTPICGPILARQVFFFLVEGSRYAGTWVRAWLVMLPLVWRVLVG